MSSRQELDWCTCAYKILCCYFVSSFLAASKTDLLNLTFHAQILFPDLVKLSKGSMSCKAAFRCSFVGIRIDLQFLIADRLEYLNMAVVLRLPISQVLFVVNDSTDNLVIYFIRKYKSALFTDSIKLQVISSMMSTCCCS